MPIKPLLSIVAIPIGNPEDITLRAIETLRQADAIICEEIKEASKLLKRLEITGKELIPLNEHNEIELVPSLLMRLVQTNQHMALISDCGTPVFSDPGAALIGQAADYGIQVTPVPGASSLMAARYCLLFPKESKSANPWIVSITLILRSERNRIISVPGWCPRRVVRAGRNNPRTREKAMPVHASSGLYFPRRKAVMIAMVPATAAGERTRP